MTGPEPAPAAPPEEPIGPDDLGPVVDADGLVVDTAGLVVSDALRRFFAGRVRAACGHYMYASERRAGLDRCERC